MLPPSHTRRRGSRLPLTRHVGGRGAMRKTGMLVAMVAVMVALFATAAYAATIEGNDNANALFETLGDDRMFGFDGLDVPAAHHYGGEPATFPCSSSDADPDP